MKRTLALILFLSFLSVPSANARPLVSHDGSFAIDCERTVRAARDPILFAGMKGMPFHMHDFYGAKKVPDGATPASITQQDSSSSCTKVGDKSAYWMPTMYEGGKPRSYDQAIQAYYRLDEGSIAMPTGLVMIAGDYTRTKTDPQQAGWMCDTTKMYTTAPDNCSGGTPLAHVIFPSCWDGVHLDSENHRSHVAYPNQYDECPADHPVKIPLLEVYSYADFQDKAKRYPLALSSGSTGGLHADFVSGWGKAAFEKIMRRCGSKDCEHLKDDPDTPITAEVTQVVAAQATVDATKQSAGSTMLCSLTAQDGRQASPNSILW